MLVTSHTINGKINQIRVSTDYVGILVEIGEDNVVNVYQTDGRLNILGKQELIKSIENKSNIKEVLKENNAKSKVQPRK